MDLIEQINNNTEEYSEDVYTILFTYILNDKIMYNMDSYIEFKPDIDFIANDKIDLNDMEQVGRYVVVSLEDLTLNIDGLYFMDSDYEEIFNIINENPDKVHKLYDYIKNVINKVKIKKENIIKNEIYEGTVYYKHNDKTYCLFYDPEYTSINKIIKIKKYLKKEDFDYVLVVNEKGNVEMMDKESIAR